MDSARPAGASDLATIVELATELAAELAPMRGGWVWSRREARPTVDADVYRSVLARADAHVVVGCIDGTVIGFGIAVLETLHDGERLGVIPELFVTDGARAVGVGEGMLAQLLGWCRAAGCVGVDTLALPGHRAAKNFFEQSGFTARAIVMHRALEPHEDGPTP